MNLSPRGILRSVSHSLGNVAFQKKIKKRPDVFFTLKEICQRAGLDINSFDAEVQLKFDQTVSYICRWGDRFTKQCICVKLYDDTDEQMRVAYNKGALVCVTDKKIDGIDCIVVDNPAVVYSDMCAIVRETAKTKSTVIAGSIGKTSTKKMVEAVYRQHFNTLCDSGNDNILDSVGSICQHMPQKAEQYIAEFSEDTPGLIEQMSKITKPEIAIITTIDKSHIEFYGSEENIFNEFRSITKYMNPDGVCIMSQDENSAKTLINDKRVVFVSKTSTDADFYASNILCTEMGLVFDVTEKKTGNTYPVKLFNSFAEHNITIALLAFAAGVEAGVPYDKIIKGIASYRATGIRQNIYRAGKRIVYADCYNAVAKSIRSAITAASIIPIKGRRIAVLGDVAEAGNYTESTHLEIADIVNDSSFDIVMTCGKELKTALHNTKMRDDLRVLTFDTQKSMNKKLKKEVKNGDLVLFKSSHSGNLEKSIRETFPLAYLYQAIIYYTPRVLWHFKVILH